MRDLAAIETSTNGTDGTREARLLTYPNCCLKPPMLVRLVPRCLLAISFGNVLRSWRLKTTPLHPKRPSIVRTSLREESCSGDKESEISNPRKFTGGKADSLNRTIRDGWNTCSHLCRIFYQYLFTMAYTGMIFTIVQLMLCRLFLSTLEFETSETGQKQAERTYARDFDRAYSGRQRSPKSGPLYKDTESLVSVNQDLKEEVREEAGE